MMPFITEEIWQKLPLQDKGPSIMVAQWPSFSSLERFVDEEAERSVELVRQVIASVRSVRSRYQIGNKVGLEVLVKADEASCVSLEAQRDLIAKMANVEHLTIAPSVEKIIRMPVNLPRIT